MVVAGTFGPIHDGHRALFREALRHGDEGVVVGLTSDDFATSTRERDVPAFERRSQAVRTALDEADEWGRDVEIRKIHDQFAIVEEDPSIDTIVVSTETSDAVPPINERRVARDLEPLEAIVVPIVTDSSGQRISSTRMVEGEVDEHGAPLS